MDGRSVKPTRVRTLGIAFALLAVVGGGAFWTWRQHAPLSRTYRRAKQRQGEKRSVREPNLKREPDTDPV